MTTPQPGDLKVWHVPQVPGKAFEVPVSSLVEATKILDVLADYDLFQYHNRIKHDYSNAGGVTRWEEDDMGGWGWYDVDDDELAEALEADLVETYQIVSLDEQVIREGVGVRDDNSALEAAERRFLTDPQFHAEVQRTVDLLGRDLFRNTGARMNPDDRSLALVAASVALTLHDIPLQLQN